jgi:hypothetical protein
LRPVAIGGTVIRSIIGSPTIPRAGVTRKLLVTASRRGAAGGPIAPRRTIGAWQERIRDPSLTVLLALELALVFVAAPLAAKGLPIARPVIEGLLLAVVAVVVLVSHRRGPITAISIGLAATLASRLFGSGWPPVAASLSHHGGDILTFAALTWAVLHAVYAPGRITIRRLQGAAVVYLNLATIFASLFSLIWELNPAAFTLPAAPVETSRLATMLYFSLTSLTTTGYGDIAPLDPFARGAANLEAMTGLFYLAITVARLVTLELEDRRR